MRNVVVRMFTFLRARWRWTRGRCPRCSRNLSASFPYYMADDPHCPVCEDETRTDLRMWHQYRALGTGARPETVTGSRVDPRAGRRRTSSVPGPWTAGTMTAARCRGTPQARATPLNGAARS